jgi:hypothetical protein
VVAGAILAPIFTIHLIQRTWPYLGAGERAVLPFLGLMFSVPVGAFLGYLTGTCAAGVFLVMDRFERYWQAHSYRTRAAA